MTMPRAQVALLMDELTNHYREEMTAEAGETWFQHINHYDHKVADDAVGWLIDNSPWFPMVSQFHEAARMFTPNLKELGRTERDEDCPDCRGALWVEVEPLVVEEGVPGRTYEQWKPCRLCNPVGYERWLEVRKPPLRKPREETYEANPRQWIDAARNAIKNIDDL